MTTKPTTIAELPEFRRMAERFMARDEIDQIGDYLAWNPLAGAVIRGTGGVRKLRWALEGRGKSGGARVIYYYHDDRWPLLLITIYPKGTKEDITDAERNAMKRLVEAIKAARKPG